MNAIVQARLPLMGMARRERLALAAALATLMLPYVLRHWQPLPRATPPEAAVVVQLAPTPAQPVLQPQPQPQPQSQPQPVRSVTPPHTPPQPSPQPAPAATHQAATPVTPSPSPMAAPSTAPVAPAAPSAARPAVHASEAPAPRVNASADREFEAKVRALIEQQKTYPSGRQAAIEKPEGTVHACVELARDGSVQAVRLEQSSGSPLLDQAARRLLGGLAYPAFPDASYGGAAQHAFCTRLKYEPPTN